MKIFQEISNFYFIISVFFILLNFAIAACPPNTWQCADGVECINETLKCDNVNHCSDGSDEGSVCSTLTVFLKYRHPTK